jgi:hypothetical protein
MYVGVASVASARQAATVAALAPPPDVDMAVNIGIQVSDKTRRGLPISEKWQPRMPAIDRLAGLMESRGGCINIIHVNTDEPETHIQQLEDLIERTGGAVFEGGLNGFQLNMPDHYPWPDPEQIDLWPAGLGGWRMILTVGPAALESVGNDPNSLVSRLQRYQGIATDVMFDLSQGRGVGADPDRLRPYLLAAREHFPEMGLVVAGGLGPGTLQPWKQLRRAIPDLSLDAESRLRDGQNQLDVGRVRAYVEEVYAEVRENEAR